MTQVVIIGAGPGGLGTAWRLAELGFTDFLVLERNSYPGGLAASFQTPEGFIFDIGGHVFFSRDPYFNRVAETLLKPGHELHYQNRNAFVYLMDRTVPYPFQDNIAALPPETQFDILRDLIRPGREKSRNRTAPRNFLSWMHRHFRKTLAGIFMEPYNRKVWAFDLKKMGSYWINDRVSTLDVQAILKRVIYREQTCDWGPNAQFFFPHLGSGHLFERMTERLADKIMYNAEVATIRTGTREIMLTSGQVIPYSHLVSSMPLVDLVRRSQPPGENREHRACLKAAAGLRYNSGLIIGLGIDFDIQSDKHWIYFPEAVYPWFRMTVISNYSPAMTPPGKSSLMFDISFNPYRGITTQAQDIIPLLKTVNFLPPIETRHITSVFEQRVKYFYPIPTLARDRDLQIINRFFDHLGIFTIGRFGRWRYEEGNMDHAFLQGKATAERILQQL